ncbi:MAG: LytTR family transcriptional regulator DNA-binding domain-containing protein [Bacteroidales bacterium]
MSRSLHFVFWGITFLALTLSFGPSYGGYAQSFFFVCFLFPVIVGTSVVFNAVLVPRFLLQRKYGRFALYSVYALVFSVYLEILVMTLALVVFANYQYERMNPKTTDLLFLTVVMYLLVFANTIAFLLQAYFQGQRTVETLRTKQENRRRGVLIVKSQRRNISLDHQAIRYVESVGNYVRIHVSPGQPVLTKEKLGVLEERLPDSFLRIHRSIVVNRDHVSSFNRETVQLGDLELPVSRKFKDAAMECLMDPGNGLDASRL